MYKYRYVDRLQEKWLRASLAFGSAIDEALNILLESKDLEKATNAFEKKWNFQYVHGNYVALRDNPNLVYSERDLDLDLIAVSEEDDLWIKSFKDYKKTKKWREILEEDRSRYNTFCWDSLLYKGKIILRDYSLKILPKFLEVNAIQYKNELQNSDGDVVVQYLDIIVTLQDGSIVLMDNKTTSDLSYYTDESPGTSQQLISYYFAAKDKFNLGAVGYIAIQKNLIKNKKKTCIKCGTEAEEGSRVKTCAIETEPGNKKSRCGGDFSVEMNPECLIKLIINPVTEAAENLVLDAFDEANVGIKSQNWYKNLTVCGNMYGNKCPYFDLCWKGEDKDLVKVEKRS